jgi:hypothetical protein
MDASLGGLDESSPFPTSVASITGTTSNRAVSSIEIG